jgi:hypothetical protein
MITILRFDIENNITYYNVCKYNNSVHNEWGLEIIALSIRATLGVIG